MMNDMIIDHGALPDIQSARLPATYEAAVVAIRECVRMDECKDWADRAAAIASYAKQAQDETLLKMARRIQMRAYQRVGELLKHYEVPANHHEAASTRDAGGLTRNDAAANAGLSERERKTALQIASVKDFEALVESDEPPTITELARRGTQSKQPAIDPEEYLKGRDPEDFAQATQLIGLFRRFARDSQSFELKRALRGLHDEERRRLLDLAVECADFACGVVVMLEEGGGDDGVQQG